MASKQRMISASKLVIVLAKKFRNGMIHYDDLLAAIADMPTVDAEEVTRCKNCRSWERNIESSPEHGTCYCHGFNRGIVKHENGYCDKGKRRC